MLPSNQLKPGRGVPVSECSFDWTTTASAMETNGTVMDPKHYKATNYSNDNVTGNSINTEILTKQLPLAVTERSNAVTMELIKAHNKSRVPLTATNNYTPHVIVPGIKTQNPFGAPQKPVQIGFLHKPPQQVNQASTNPRPSTTHGSGRRRRNGSDLNNEEKNGSTPSTQRSHSFCASSRPQTTTGIPRFKLTDKLYPTNTKERIFDPKEPTAAELQLTQTLNAVSASPDASVAPPNEVEHAANQWGELTSVVDMYMHPSNNVNRKYPTPDWVPGEMKSRNAFKLRV
jgi:hypothetical protein